MGGASRRLRPGARVILLVLSGPVAGVPLGPAAAQQGAVELTPIVVEGERVAEPTTEFDAPSSTTRINATEIERRQPGDVFDLVDRVPGVSVQGGPRTSGKAFVIRGFDDSEDTLVRIDGATRNFEKYRFGSGLFLDPELLERVEVHRGPATITLGAGALGGVVLFETKEAADLLEPGRRAGARLKLGYRSNDEGRLVSASGYARPVPWLDVLVNRVQRHGNDLELPGGERLEASDEDQRSVLAKVTLEGGALGTLGLGVRAQRGEGLEPFDATGGGPGVGGTVRRATRERSGTLRYEVAAHPDWLDLHATLGYTDTDVVDHDSAVAGGGTDRFDYDVRNAEIGSTTRFDLGGASYALRLGLQGTREARRVVRTNVLGTGFNAAQPPGVKRSAGKLAQLESYHGDVTATLGVRADRYEVEARGASARALRNQGRSTVSGFSRWSPGAGLVYRPGEGPLAFFYNYAQAFRPPLLDEYFTAGSLSRCFSHSGFTPAPVAPTLMIPPGATAAEIVAFVNRFNADLAAYQAAVAAFEDDPFARTKAICGDEYEPETAVSHEIGVTFASEGVLLDDDALSVRAMIFHTRVGNLLESIYEDSVTGEVSQPGVEVHRGLEIELAYETRTWFTSASLSLLDGYVKLGYFESNANPLVTATATAADRAAQPLFNVPGDALTFTLGRRYPGWRLEYGYRLRMVASRRATTGFRPGCTGGLFTIPSCFLIERQPGYTLHNLFVSWRPSEALRMDLALDNLGNKRYRLSGFGGGLGTVAPGRDVRLSVSYRF